MTTTRFGVDGNLITSNGGGNITTTLQMFTAVTDADIAASTYLPFAYDFTLAKQAGSIGAVNWLLKVGFTGDGSPVTIGSGSLGSAQGMATFTGTGSYTTSGIVAADFIKDLNVYLYLTYSMSPGDNLFVGMNSASQGITINAVAIPEPATYGAILGFGVLGALIISRSRRVRAA